MTTPADEPDFQLTGDDPMLEQIESATSRRVPPHADDSPQASSPDPLDPGKPEWMQHEPDASQ